MLRTARPALLIALLAALACAVPATAAEPCTSPERVEPAARTAAVTPARAATLLFIPGPVRTPQPDLTDYLEQLPGFAVGLFSPTLGRYSPTQMMLDISQGARVAGSHYRPVVPQPPALVRTVEGGGRLEPWRTLVRRAEQAPAEIVPGLLGCTLEQAGRSVAWYGFDGSPTITSIAAAGSGGGIVRIGTAGEPELASALIRAEHSSDLLVAAVPEGHRGLGVARRLAAATPERLLIVVQAPPEPARTRLLSFAVRGIDGPGGVRSETTRRDGLVAATDFAPTILERLGVARPGVMQGRAVSGGRQLSAAELTVMNDRLALVAGRRAPLALALLGLCALAVLLVLGAGLLTGRFKELSRLCLRLAGLAMMYAPLLLLVTAAMHPTRQTEINVALVGSVLLALATDRLVAWPRALAVPAAAVVVGHGIDFIAFGGRFTGQSLFGSNPLYGARFFGVGNELEAVITVACVLGAGAALSDSRVRRPAVWFAGLGALLALYLGAGRIGADVGGVIYAGAAFGAAAVYQARLRLTPLRSLLIATAVVAGLVLIVLLDSLTGGESHLTRTIVEAESAGDLVDVVRRRFAASLQGAGPTAVWSLMLVCLTALLVGWLRRDRLLARLTAEGEDPAARRPYRAGLTGALVGTVIGALANDSGPAILIIGTIFTATGLLYLRGRPV